MKRGVEIDWCIKIGGMIMKGHTVHHVSSGSSAREFENDHKVWSVFQNHDSIL